MSPTYHLAPGARQTLPEASVEVLLSTPTAGVIGPDSLVASDGSHARVVPVGGSRWIVQWGEAGSAELSVRAAGRQPFPVGTTVQASIRLLVPQQIEPRDVVEVTLDGVDGLTLAPLLTISRPEGGPLTFVRQSAPSIPEIVESEVGRGALAAARQLVDDSRYQPTARRPLVIAVDGSASMQPLWEAGTVAQVVDLVRGLAPVVGTEEGPRVAHVSDEVRWIDRDGPDDALTAAHADAGVCLVTVPTPLALYRAADPRSIIFVVTDELPWPLPSGEDGITTHVVLIGAQPQLPPSVQAEVRDRGIHVTTVDQRRLPTDKGLVLDMLSPYLSEV